MNFEHSQAPPDTPSLQYRDMNKLLKTSRNDRKNPRRACAINGTRALTRLPSRAMISICATVILLILQFESVHAQNAVRLAPPKNNLENNRLVPPTNRLGPKSQSASPVDAKSNIDELVTRLVLEQLPHTYTDDRKWGMQDERWDGVHIKRDGWKIKTKRKKKLVNHGTWRKYTAELVNPQKEFAVDVHNIHQIHEGKLGFDVDFVAHLKLHGRQSKWVKGVQLYSVSADGYARVRLSVSCEMAIELDFVQFPPDIVCDPKITNAEIVIDEFKLNRVSKLGGEFAQQVTRASRRLLEGKIEEREVKLVKKLNEKIDEQRDDLRISLYDAAKSEWTEKALPELPDEIQRRILGVRK